MSVARTAFAWTVFPIGLCSTVAAAMAMMERGVAPEAALYFPILISYAAVLTLERFLPLHQSWKHSRGDVHVDIGHAVVSGGVTLMLLRPLMLALTVVVAAWLSAAIPVSLWPTHWNLIAQLVLALIVGEFFLYWAHRLGHTIPLLWRFHAVHHSAPRLYGLNAARFHPVDLAISYYAPWVALVVLGADGRVLALFGLVAAVHGIFQHTNLPIRCGPLNWFFSMAELHRWHHSRVLEEANTNYGQNLIVWDVVFGTRFLPKDREPPEDVGLHGMPDFPMDYVGQVLSPIQWARFADPPETDS
ncbi:MAG: sterol desaturase family protein [bacterium]|nr:sterol desaturase family protein [bacterium]MCP5069840.1 sterol desaturase family protein [bacterium]